MAKKKEENTESQDKKDTLQLALDKLEKDYGEGTVISGGYKSKTYDIVSSGSLSLDIALGVGGFARGKVYEFIGWESSGKSTGTLEVIAQAQSKYPNEKCALIDGEHSFDPTYAKAIGVDVDALLISQPQYGEQGYEVALKLMDSGKVSVVIIDSQTALRPKAEIEGNVGSSKLGLHARLMSEVLPKILNSAARNNVLVIFISQLREKIGVMFGSPETTNGGHALKFYAHGRLRWRRVQTNKDGEESISNGTEVKVIKNKLAAPFKIASFNIVFGVGIDRTSELVQIASELDVIKKSGSWYSYNDLKIGQGADNVCMFLNDNPEVFTEVKDKVLALINKGQGSSLVKQGAPEAEFEDEN